MEHKPNILCLFWFDLTKYNKLSLKFILLLYFSIIDVSKKGVSHGKVAIHWYPSLFFLIHFIAVNTPTNGQRFPWMQSGTIAIEFNFFIFKS